MCGCVSILLGSQPGPKWSGHALSVHAFSTNLVGFAGLVKDIGIPQHSGYYNYNIFIYIHTRLLIDKYTRLLVEKYSRWLGTLIFYDFPYFGNVIIPTDELIFFRWVETTNQITIIHTRLLIDNIWLMINGYMIHYNTIHIWLMINDYHWIYIHMYIYI